MTLNRKTRLGRSGVQPGEKCPVGVLSAGHKSCSHKSELSWEVVNEIRKRRFSERLTYKQLSEIYGTSKSTMHSICLGRSWRPA